MNLHEIRKGSAHFRKKDRVHPAHLTPYEVFPGYSTDRLKKEDLFCKTSKWALEELESIYRNPMFSYGGLEPFDKCQKVLECFLLNRPICVFLFSKKDRRFHSSNSARVCFLFAGFA